MSTDESLRALIAGRDQAVLATLRRDGRPQLSTVTYTFDAGRDLIRVSVTADRAKTRNLARDPRATVHVAGPDGGWSYAVADVTATVWPTAQRPDDDSVEELIDIYRSVQGEHPDWDEYRAAMVADRRVPLHLAVDRVYGLVR